MARQSTLGTLGATYACRAAMPHSHRVEWMIGFAFFAAILLALVIAAAVIDPFTANLP